MNLVGKKIKVKQGRNVVEKIVDDMELDPAGYLLKFRGEPELVPARMVSVVEVVGDADPEKPVDKNAETPQPPPSSRVERGDIPPGPGKPVEGE